MSMHATCNQHTQCNIEPAVTENKVKSSPISSRIYKSSHKPMAQKKTKKSLDVLTEVDGAVRKHFIPSNDNLGNRLM